MTGRQFSPIFKWAVKSFCDLVQVNAPSGSELQMAAAIELQLSELGVNTINRDRIKGPNGQKTANLFAFVPGTADGPILGFNAHMDRVEPGKNIKPREKNGKIISSGKTILAADDVAGIAIILAMLKALRDLDLPHPPLQLIFTASEELRVWGAKHINRDLIKADMIFSFDGEGPAEIYHGGVASDKYFIEITGKLAHAGLEPEKGIPAPAIAARALNDLAYQGLWGRLPEGTCNFIISAHSEVGTNSIQDRVTIRGETRSQREEYLDELRPLIFEPFRRARKKWPGSDVVCRAERAYNAWGLEESHPVVQRACKAVKAVGLRPELKIVPGGVDAAWFNQYGRPSVVLGVGVENPHTKEEKLDLDEFHRAIQIAIKLATSRD